MKINDVSILSIVVLYKQSFYSCLTYSSFLKESLLLANTTVFIYDNSPSPQHRQDEFESDRIIYIHDKMNSGLSKAYNLGAKYAADNDIEWILLLDQDTKFPEGALNDYLRALQDNPSIFLFSPKHKIHDNLFLSPTVYRHKISRPSSKAPVGDTSLLHFTPINSGMLINVDAFMHVGGYNERVSLDFSDVQFLERFKLVYDRFYVLDICCLQNFSSNDTDVNKLLKRYAIFCSCIRNCDKISFTDYFDYFFLGLKRAMSLVIKCKSLVPINIFFTIYCKK